MGTLAPLGLGLLALAAPIVALYMLKMRRREQIVSSTFLWEEALRDVRANAPWQRLRPNLLLLLQLLALAALVLAVARPFRTGATPLGTNLVVILDVSGSMAATDVAPSRLERGKDEVRRLIDDLPGGGTMTILTAGAGAEVLQAATDNRATLRSALDRVRGRGGATDFREALALAAPAADRLPDTTVVIVGDGAFPNPGATDLRAPLRFVRVGERSENLAITAAATRRAGGGGELFVRVQNFGQTERKTLLSIYDDTVASGGGTLIEARALTVPPGGEAGTTIGPLPTGVGLLRATIDAADDLALDNTAWVRPGAAGKLRVLLTSAGPNTFLDRGLALQQNLVVDRAQGGGDGAVAEGGLGADYDLYVYDGVAPPREGRGPVLLINPPAGNGLVTVKGTLDRPVVVGQDRDHTVMRGVDLSKVRIATAATIEPPAWGRTLADAGGAPPAPLLLVGEPGGRRTAILAFDLHRSDLPLTLGFPILLANLTGWLAPEGGTGLPETVRPGEPIAITPRPGVGTVAITGPDGRERRLAPQREGTRSVLFAATDTPGPYVVRELEGEREVRRGLFTVNLLSAEESNIAPRDLQPGLTAAAPAGEGAAAPPARRELWRPLLATGLAILAAEWWFFYRGPLERGTRNPARASAERGIGGRASGREGTTGRLRSIFRGSFPAPLFRNPQSVIRNRGKGGR